MSRVESTPDKKQRLKLKLNARTAPAIAKANRTRPLKPWMLKLLSSIISNTLNHAND